MLATAPNGGGVPFARPAPVTRLPASEQSARQRSPFYRARGDVLRCAARMSGGTYTIVSDVALAGPPDVGGNCRVVATVGEAATASPTAANGFRIYAGFWQGRIIQPCMLDIDGNGLVEPTFDGVLIARALNGVRGQALVDGALGAGRCSRLRARFLPGSISMRWTSMAIKVVELNGWTV